MSVQQFVGTTYSGANCLRAAGNGLAFALASLAALTSSALSESRAVVSYPAVLAGIPRVVDGDTLVIDGMRVRLEGIDAPETGQTCGRKDGAGTWDCGNAATHELKAMIGHNPISCDNLGTEKYGRMLGRCHVNGLNLNAELVRRGYAWAYVKYSRVYVTVESEARAVGAGIWQGEAMPAWDYRKSRWQEQAALAPNGCAIKGNVSRTGKIYHLPWSPWYDKVRLDKGKGERWFCSEADAQAAGWRAARVW